MNWFLDDYRASDASACARVMSRAWNVGHPYAAREIGPAGFERGTANETVIVARSPEGGVIGLVSIYQPDPFIHHLYVDPAWTRRGIGRSLLARALALAGGTATLKCQVRNAEAMRFYEREGWTGGELGETEGEAWVRMLSPARGT